MENQAFTRARYSFCISFYYSFF